MRAAIKSKHRTNAMFCGHLVVENMLKAFYAGGIVMKKGFYLFTECGFLSKILSFSSAVFFIISIILIFFSAEPNIHTWYFGLINGRFEFRTIHAWILIFFMLGIVQTIINISIHKICTDIATLLKESQEINLTKNNKNILS